MESETTNSSDRMCAWPAVLDEFERAWQSGVAPGLDDYLRSCNDDATRIELVRIDLEYRWRQPDKVMIAAGDTHVDRNCVETEGGIPPQPLLDDYARYYQFLGPVAELSLELIGDEYRARCQWGQRPRRDEFVARFHHPAKRLEALLDRIDAELDADDETLPGDEGRWRDGLKPPSSSPPGYEILDELGRGGMGVVYRARQHDLNRVVALKVTLWGEYALASERNRFRTEAESVARLKHPNIVPVFEIGEHAGHPFYVFEYVEGGSLARQLTGTPVAAKSAAEFIETLCSAMDTAHRQGIVHRDLTPSNILLAPLEPRAASGAAQSSMSTAFHPRAWLPKISDFGLAKRLDGEAELTQTGAIIGSPSYMAPEQAAGNARQAGPAADIYALGAILYELLTGRPPFKGPSPMDTVEQVRSLEPVPPRRLQQHVPRDLETICLKCLAKEPRCRYATAAALAEDLRRFLDGKPIEARRASAWERGLKWARRRPATAALALVILMAAAGALLGGIVHQIRLREALDVADRQRQRAREGYRQAYEAVDKMLTQVASDRLADVPETHELRRELLTEARDFYRRFLDQPEEVAAQLRRECATACVRLALIERLMGDLPAAEADLRESLTRRRELAAEFPDRADLAGDLAESEHDLGLVLFDQGRGDEARDHYESALAIWQRLAKTEPAFRGRLPLCYENIATLCQARDAAAAEKYYREAIGLREKLLDEDSYEPAAQSALAHALFNLGAFHFRVSGRLGEALAPLERAADLWEPLLGQPGSRHANYAEAAECHKALGLLLTGSKPDEAEGHFGRSIELVGEMARRHPEVPAYQVSLSQAHGDLALLYQSRNNMARAEAEFLEACRIRERLAEERPDDLREGIGRAELYSNFGNFQLATAGPVKAEPTLRRAVEAVEPLLAKRPDDAAAQFALGCACTNLANTLKALGGRDEAVDCHSRSIAALEAALRAAPDSVSYREQCLNAHGARAVTLAEFERHAEARADWDRVVELALEPHRANYRAMRAVNAVLAGDYTAATDETAQLLAGGALSADQKYNAACVFARGAAAAQADESLPAAERTRLAAVYRNRSISVLRKLGRAGYFKSPQRLLSLFTDPDLASVRLGAICSPIGGSP